MTLARSGTREGQWFAVPLDDGSFAIGLVARDGRAGVLVGYFFGPARSSVPGLEQTRDLEPGGAVLVGKFGHLGLRDGSWPVIGTDAAFDRAAWPMPRFVRREELTGRTLEVSYDEDDPSRLLEQTPLPPGDARPGPDDGLMGVGYVQGRLSQLLV